MLRGHIHISVQVIQTCDFSSENSSGLTAAYHRVPQQITRRHQQSVNRGVKPVSQGLPSVYMQLLFSLRTLTTGEPLLQGHAEQTPQTASNL